MTLRKFFLLYSILLMLVLVGVFLGYRALVSIPKVKSNVLAYQQREVSTVYQSLDNQFELLRTINYDYAVWNDSYSFYADQNDDFINDNFIPDTFVSLKIDGIYYISLQGDKVWGMGFDWEKEEELNFESEYNAYSIIAGRLLDVLKSPAHGQQISGFLQTNVGPTMYSASLLRHSDNTGPDIGALIFLRKLRPGVITKVAKLAGVKISSSLPIQSERTLREDLMKGPAVSSIMPKRYYYIGDVRDEPVIYLDVEHSLYEELKLVDSQTLSIIALLAIIPISLQLLVNFSLLKPLTHSINTVGQMLEKGQLKVLKNTALISEINTLNQDFNQLIETVTEQKDMMENLSLLDGLTNIANRRSFEKHFATTWQAMMRNNDPLAVLMCDIDYFKPYNDNYGHLAGDNALIMVVQALQKRIARPHELVARYGGEEFVIILPSTNYVQCQQVIEAIQNLLAELNIRHEFSEVSNIMTMSIGAATIEHANESFRNCNADDFLRVADKALYQAKREGRNRYVIERFSADILV